MISMGNNWLGAWDMEIMCPNFRMDRTRHRRIDVVSSTLPPCGNYYTPNIEKRMLLSSSHLFLAQCIENYMYIGNLNYPSISVWFWFPIRSTSTFTIAIDQSHFTFPSGPSKLSSSAMSLSFSFDVFSYIRGCPSTVMSTVSTDKIFQGSEYCSTEGRYHCYS